MTNYSLADRFLFLLAPLSSLLFVTSSAQLIPTNHGTSGGFQNVSIDCGSSTSSYTDNNSIVWIGDSRFIKTGETHNVEFHPRYDELESLASSVVLSTLRVFTIGKKNCYSMNAGNGIGTKRVLVRASFFYGNYDNKSTPPTFDLYFNGNLWDTVTNSMFRLGMYEGVFAVKRNTIDVCLVQTLRGHLPFISALEVRRLDTGMYGHIGSDYPLNTLYSIAFGINKTVRFPVDVYDRIWTTYDSKDFNKQTTDSSSLTVDDAEDNPPKSVIQTGIIPSNPNSSLLQIPLVNLLDHGSSPIYITAYFSEIFKLNSTQKRSFWMYIDSKRFKTGPIIPPYGSVLEIHIPNVTPLADTVETEIVLEPTSDSTLPPLINAMEVFFVLNNGASGMLMSRCLLKTMLFVSLLLVTIHCDDHLLSLLGGFRESILL